MRAIFYLLLLAASILQTVRPRDITYEIQVNDTLWKLAERFCHDPNKYTQILMRNWVQLRGNPNMISPHMKIVIPCAV